ncbi:MAG: type III secretion system inner membrane ring lipoprotein SctJ [Lautropia sp.]
MSASSAARPPAARTHAARPSHATRRPRAAASVCRRAAAALVVATLLGCSQQPLYSQLTERQANEMVAALLAAGIDARKLAHEGQYAIATAERDIPSAVRTLNAQGYPRETFDTIGKIFKREGFVSSPLEERARLMHAMSQEISATLAQIDGVVTARVHLAVPEHNPLADKPAPASAAVFIKHRPDRNLAAQTAQIKALVVNSIEGLGYDNVTVALFPAESLPPAAAAKPVAATLLPFGVPMPTPLLAGAAGGLAALGAGLMLALRRRTVRT